MAGIGFELRKAISKEESLGGRASGYLGAAFSSSGSILVGILLFYLIQTAAKLNGIGQSEIDEFMCYVTNTMFWSMLTTSVITLAASRYVSDMIYSGHKEKIMPSLIGSSLVVSLIGGSLFAIYLGFSGVDILNCGFLLFLYLVLNNCWLLMSYITLIRDYKWVVFAYLSSLLISIIALIVVCKAITISVTAMIFVLTLGFAVVDVLLFKAVYNNFPSLDNSYFSFLRVLKSNPSVVLVGFFMMAGMLGHFWITWFLSSTSETITTLFRYNPDYDFPAIVAYFSTIPSAIYFITLFETNFGEKYQRYFYKLGHGATVDEIEKLRNEMIDAISSGIKNLFYIQLITSLLFVTIGAKLLSVLNIGMTELMLDTFRIFCIGYSLYFILNTLVIINLYFANERRIKWSAGLFALGSIVSACLSATIWQNSYGEGFVITSAILVVVVILQLIKFLKNLEYNTFCGYKSIDYKSNGSKSHGKLSALPRRKILATMVAICLVVTIGSGGLLVKNLLRKSNITTYTPKASDAVLKSPGMGLAPWADSDETINLDTSLVYVELKWSDWEPNEGEYNVDFVNDNYNLEYYREEGRNVVFRFICDEPTDEMHMDIPEWLYAAIGEDGTWYDISYGRGFSPNYENEIFIAKHAEAVAALGEFFGKDDFFIYVELGSLGHWGEWHVDYENGIKPIPSFATREEYIKPYLDAFPNATFLLRYPLIDATTYQMGLYNDMTGDYDETKYWLDQMNGGVWEQTGLEEQSECTDLWKTNPIGGEFASTYSNSSFLIENFDLTYEGIVSSHQSFIGPKIIIDESDDDYSNSMNKILKTLGYRYRVSEVQIDTNEKETFGITCTMVNDGIAPIYQKYNVEISILDSEDSVVWTAEDIDFDLRTLLPDEEKSFTCVAQKELFDDDTKYKLVISVQDDNGIAKVPLALKSEISEKTYCIAEFYVN